MLAILTIVSLAFWSPNMPPTETPVTGVVTQEHQPLKKKFVTAFAKPDEIGTLNVDIKRGAITVVGHDDPEVIVELEVPNYTPEAKDHKGLTELRPNNLDFDITTSGNEIKVDSNSERYITHLKIKVPRSTNLVLDSYRDGKLQVTKVHGHLDVRSFHSHITLTDCSGSADLYSYHGNLVASFNSIRPDEPLEFESYNGSIDLSLPADIRVNTQLRTGHGKMLTDFDITETGDPVKTETQKAGTSKIEFEKFVRGTINGGGSVVKAESEHDDIRIRRNMTGLGKRLGQEWNGRIGKRLGEQWNQKLGPGIGQEWNEKLGKKLGKEWNERLNRDGATDK